MVDIKCIVIKGSSGYGCVSDAYKDKVKITSDKILYEYIPLIESDDNPKRKWSYKTNSISFKNKFEQIAEMIPEIMKNEIEQYYLDIGGIEFNITYADKTRQNKTYLVPSDYFEELFMMIRSLVPESECVPEVLLISKDYEEDYGTFDVVKNTIYINLDYMKDLNDYEVLFYIYHELRHAVQYNYPDKFSSDIKESLNYVILYNGVCYYLIDNVWEKCELDGEDDYTDLYLSLPYEMDANEYAFNQTLKNIKDISHKEALIKIYEFYKPKAKIDFEKLRSVFSEIRDKINN